MKRFVPLILSIAFLIIACEHHYTCYFNTNKLTFTLSENSKVTVRLECEKYEDDLFNGNCPFNDHCHRVSFLNGNSSNNK